MEDYNSLSQNEYRFVSALELLDFKFTGNNSNSLMICLDKSLCKQILISEKINAPQDSNFSKKMMKLILNIFLVLLNPILVMPAGE